MLPPNDHAPTLIDSGEFMSEGSVFGGLPVTWDSGEDDDDFDEKETRMVAVPAAEPSSQRLLRVLPAVPARTWTPPPPPPSGVLPPINPPPPFRTTGRNAVVAHWVPEPPPPRVSYPTMPECVPVFAHPVLVQPFTSPAPPEAEIMEHGVGPHVAVTLQTPRTKAKRQRILRKAVLPWPAVVMVAAVAGGVIFEHAQRGDTWSTITSTVDSAERLVRR
ncbi:MAG: hypothetical protein ABIP89_25555 [Polyangiaceae bacterium]